MSVCVCPIPQWIQANSHTYPSEASNDPLNDQKNRYSNIIACEGGREGGRE